MKKNTSPKYIIGSGGDDGGKGGGGAQRTPIESPDTLKSTSYARVLDLLSEGEIEGLVDGLKSVYLDGVPVQNPDGTFNFKDVSLYDVKGTQSQGWIPGFPSAESETVVNTEVLAGTPIVRTITDGNVDAVRVTITVPQLTSQDSTTGDIRPSSVQIQIEVQSNGGGFVVQPLGNSAWIRGKCTSAYDRPYLIPLTGSAPWDIRVTRLTPNSTSTALQNKTFWKTYATVIDERLSFPNSAICALQVSARQFDSIPTRSYLIKGLKVKVPTNYDPVTRAYAGTWDGTFKIAWTDNPAWCFYDLLTTKRYGLGRFINASNVDKWGLYEIAKYCDELVPTGKDDGSTEPRFRCNLYLQTQEDAYQVINHLASIFRGMVYWASGSVYVSQDAPRDAEYLFTPANVENGLFNYTGTGRRARHTVALVTWNDPANHYKVTKEYVTDDEGLSELGYNPTEVVAIGCTSRSQAQRVGRWLLYTERLETETVSFRTGLEGALRNPGAIIKVQDPYKAGRRYGGRVVSATVSAVELDSDVTIEGGKTYTLSVVLPSGAVEERQVMATGQGASRLLQLTAPFSQAPDRMAVWVLAASDLAPTTYRILSVTEVETGKYEISALRHRPEKYVEVETGVKVTTVPTSALPSTVSPSGLVLSESLYKSTTGIKVALMARWEQRLTATSYVVRWREGDGNWSTENEIMTHFWELRDITPGVYSVQVASVVNGFITSFIEATYTVLGKTAPPAGVTGLTASNNGTTATIAWNEIPDLDRDMYELRVGGTVWADSAFITKLRATSFEWALPETPGVYVIRIKAIDTSGNYSTTDATVTINTAPTTPATFTMSVSSTPPT